MTLILGVLTSAAWAQIPNAGFERWDSSSVLDGIRIYNPENWSSSNIEMINFNGTQTVELTTDAHSGNYAVKLTSAVNDNSEQATYLSSGLNVGEGPTDPATDKFPLQGRINGFEGYYKYTPIPNDSFMIYLALYRNGDYIGQAFLSSGTSTDTYTHFHWAVNYPSNIVPPDSAKFIITPSIFDESEGSVLYIDDLNITYGFSSGLDSKQPAALLSLRSNPVEKDITLLGFDPRHRYQYQLVSIDGRLIQSGNLLQDTLSVELLESGLYALSIIRDDGLVNTLKFVKM